MNRGAQPARLWQAARMGAMLVRPHAMALRYFVSSSSSLSYGPVVAIAATAGLVMWQTQALCEAEKPPVYLTANFIADAAAAASPALVNISVGRGMHSGATSQTQEGQLGIDCSHQMPENVTSPFQAHPTPSVTSTYPGLVPTSLTHPPHST